MSQTEVQLIKDSAVVTADIADQAVTLDKLPHGTGSNDGKFLRANNGADPSFETVTSTTINNNADNRVITGSGTANTLNGESGLTYDGSNLSVTGGLDVSSDVSIADVIKHTGDTNTKIRFPAADTVSIETSGNESLRVDSSGRLLVNTTTTGNIATKIVSKVEASSNAAFAQCGLVVTHASGLNRKALIGFGFSGNGGTNPPSAIGSVSTNTASNENAALVFYTRTATTDTEPSERMRIDASGNVGIGTGSNAIQANLHVEASVPVIRMKDSDNNSAVQFVGQDGSIRYDADNDNIAANSHHAFKTDNVERVRIQAEGLTFNGDTAAANSISDYEEGTWTPSAVVTFGSGSVSSSNQVGQYTKIGSTVTCHFTIDINGSSISGNNVGIEGLPFTCQSVSNENFNSGVARRGIVGGEVYMLEEVRDNTTKINVVRKFDNTGLSNGNQSINGFFTYTTNR